MGNHTLSQVPPDSREAFLVAGVMNSIWRAHGAYSAVNAMKESLSEAMPSGLTLEQIGARRTMLTVAVGFLERALDKQFERAIVHLKVWQAYKAGELSDDEELPT